MRRRLSYANITATLALVFAMSGGALAANHYLINSTKQINPKVLKKLKGKRGATGATGTTGATGKEGPQGKEGPPGKEGAAAAIPPLTWHTATLENGWAPRKSSYGAPLTYTKDAEGFVHLSGALNGETATGQQIAVLPPGFRPTRVAFAWLRTASTNGNFDPRLVDVEISAESGTIVADPDTEVTKAKESFVSFEGLTFYAG